MGCPLLGFLLGFGLIPMKLPAASRAWVTPFVMASFVLMVGTGVLMFFRWQSPLQKDLHEWLGWGMVAAVVLHVLANLAAFQRHFAGQRRAVVLLVLAVGVVAGTYFVRPAEGKGGSAAGVAVQALSRAPLRTLAEVFGLSVDQAKAALTQAGLTVADDAATLDAAAGGSREQVGKGLKALAKAAERPGH